MFEARHHGLLDEFLDGTPTILKFTVESLNHGELSALRELFDCVLSLRTMRQDLLALPSASGTIDNIGEILEHVSAFPLELAVSSGGSSNVFPCAVRHLGQFPTESSQCERCIPTAIDLHGKLDR